MSMGTDIRCTTHDLLFRLAFNGTPLGQCGASGRRVELDIESIITLRFERTFKVRGSRGHLGSSKSLTFSVYIPIYV